MKYSTSAQGPIEPGADINMLLNFLALESSDSMLMMLLSLATEKAMNYMQSEIISRTRTVTYYDWPVSGTYTHPSISRQAVEASRDITLPFARVQSVESVEIYGEQVTDFIILDTLPASIRVDVAYRTSDVPAIEVEYVAGFGETLDDVPNAVQMGIIQLAAFLYEHRGACDADEALRKSGAASTLTPYMLRAVSL